MIEALAEGDDLGWAGFDTQAAAFAFRFIDLEQAAVLLVGDCHCDSSFSGISGVPSAGVPHTGAKSSD